MVTIEEKCALAIDIGGSKLMVGLVNYAGKLLHKLKIPLNHDISPDKMIELIMENINKLLERNGTMYLMWIICVVWI